MNLFLTILSCVNCNKPPEQSFNGISYNFWCEECYDGAPDSPTRSWVGTGLTLKEAIVDWNEIQECIKEK